MNAAGWIAVTYIVVNGTVQITKAGLGYRTAKRRDQAKSGGTS